MAGFQLHFVLIREGDVRRFTLLDALEVTGSTHITQGLTSR